VTRGVLEPLGSRQVKTSHLAVAVVDRFIIRNLCYIPTQDVVSHAAWNHPRQEVHTVKWVTRKNANVDRVACPWLIRRFVDQDAEFLYVPTEQVAAVAERESAVPYDVKDVELGHVDGRCSFESILVKYGLSDPALERLAKIVHGADVAADIDMVPEARGLQAIAHGFALVHGDDDHAKIRLETPMYDALYSWCQKQVAESR
jgi:hypothetical protein